MDERPVPEIDSDQDIYRQIFQHSVVPTIIHDLEMNILEANHSALRLFGYEREELLALSIYDLHTTSELDHSREVLAGMQEQETMSVRSTFKRSDGSAFYAEATPTRFLLDGKPVIHVFIQDVTARAEREVKARAYTEELEQFAYIASHDLTEPLRTISSFVDLIEREYRDRLDAAGAEYLDFISTASKRLYRLVEDLLGYSRLGKPEPLSEIDGNVLVAEVLAELDPLIAEKKASIRVDELPSLVGYESKLRILLLNLVANALQFSKPDVAPEIEIGVEVRPQTWELSITDNGIGMEPEDRQQIFKVFRRLDPSGPHEGSGIGLASCLKIARMHGGGIEVESKPGEGTTFRVTLSKHHP